MATILVADDDADLRLMVRTALERTGHQIVEVEDGDQVLDAHRVHQADLVVIDIFMPRQDGLVTIEQLRAEFPGVSILAISGGGHRGDFEPLRIARGLGAGALEKPFTIYELRATVEALLQSGERSETGHECE